MENSENAKQEFANDQFNKLLEAIQKSNSDTLKNIKSEIGDLRNEIKTEREKLREKITEENQKLLEKLSKQDLVISELNDKYNKINERSVDYERRFRKNNLIVFGLKVEKDIDLLEFAVLKIRQLLDVDLQPNEINNIFVINSKTGTPIKIEFVTYIKKAAVLKSAYKLKNTKIFIVQDLCYADRVDNKVLQHHYKLAKQEGKIVKIRNNKLFINEIPYTADQLRQSGNSSATVDKSEPFQIQIAPKSDSVPCTPTNQQEETTFEKVENPLKRKKLTIPVHEGAAANSKGTNSTNNFPISSNANIKDKPKTRSASAKDIVK